MSHGKPIVARVESDVLPADCEVSRLDGVEAISRVFRFDIDVVSQAKIDEEAVLATPLDFVFEQAGVELRRWHGVVAAVRDTLQTEGRYYRYRLTFVPRLWALSLHETSEVFVGQSIPEIVKAKLERTGLKQGDDYELRLLGKYAPRDYVVQYKETSLDFISRLTEHWGIFWFFEERDGREVVVFTDDNGGMGKLEPVPFYERGDAIGVFDLRLTTKTLPTRVVVKDYNYRTPHVMLLAQGSVSEAGSGEVIEYGSHFKTPGEAEHVARVRAEELRAGRRVYEATSDVVALAAGARFRVDGHPRGDVDLAITEVRHHAEQTTFGAALPDQAGYRNELRAIPAAVAYRPPRVTPKPRVHGVITGNIEAEAKDGYAELDDAGRYRVRFQFDTSGSGDGKASHAVRMAQPHSGPGYGFHFPLRHGVEVLLTCIDGDPDRPVISSAVPNPLTPATVGAGNARRNIIRTGGGNEINIDDTKGSERIKLTTPFGNSSFQIGAPNTPEAGSALSTVDAATTIAGAGVNTITSVATVMSDVASLLTASNIVDFAGAKGLADALAKGGAAKIIGGIVEVGKSIAEIPKKIDEAKQIELDGIAHEKEATAAALEEDAERWATPYPAQPPQVVDANGKARPVTKAEWDAAQPDHQTARAARQEADKAKAAAGKHKADTAPTGPGGAAKAADSLIKAGKTAAEAVEAIEKGVKAADAVAKGTAIISEAAKRTQQVMASAGGKAASAAAAAAGGFAGIARIPGVVPPIGIPHNIQAAATTAALVGLANVIVSGIAAATVTASGQAILAGGGAALVKSPGAAELAGGARAFVSSLGLVDIYSAAVLKMKSMAAMTIESMATLRVSSNAPMSLHGKSTVSMKSGAAMAVTASADLKLDGSNIAVKAPGKVEVKAGNAADLLAGSWGVRATSGKTVVGNGDSVCVLDGGGALMKKGGDQVQCKGGVTVKGSKVTVKGSGAVSIKGSRVDLG